MAKINKPASSDTPKWPPLIVGLFALASLVFLLLGSTPDKVGPLGITLFFLSVLVALLGIGMFFRATLLNNPKSTSLLAVILISACLVAILALNTIVLSWGDYVLVLLFIATFLLYWVKLRQ